MKHIGWIIILLGACLIAATSCKRITGPNVSVECHQDEQHMYPQYWVIKVGNGEWINEYYDASNITNWMDISTREDAIRMAKWFDSQSKIERWNDSVQALIKPEVKIEPLSKSPDCNEVITIY